MRDLTDVSSLRSRLQTYQRPVDHESSGRVPTGRTAYVQPEYAPRRCLQSIVEAQEQREQKQRKQKPVKPLLSAKQEAQFQALPKPRKSRPMLTLLSLKLRDLKAWWHKSLARMQTTNERPALPRPRCKCLVSTFHE